MSEVSYLSSNGQPSTRSRQANSGDRTTAQLRDIRQKQLSHVLYWRFFVNLALMLIDAAMYIIAGATVLNLRHEATPLYSSRFNFTIDSGGLCDVCNSGDCPACGQDDEDWL